MEMLDPADALFGVLGTIAGLLAIASAVVLVVVARGTAHARAVLVAGGVEVLAVIGGSASALVAIHAAGQRFGSTTLAWMYVGPAARILVALASALVVVNVVGVRILRGLHH